MNDRTPERRRNQLDLKASDAALQKNPKRGFTNIWKKEYNHLNVDDFNVFEAAPSSLQTDQRKGLAKQVNDGTKFWEREIWKRA